MKIPFVIDNRDYILANILNDLLKQYQHRSLDIASAFFTVSGYRLLREGLENIGSFRLLLGAEPTTGENIGLHPDPGILPRLLTENLEQEAFREDTLRLVEDLIAYLRLDSVDIRLVQKSFLHAKCYLIYGDKPTGQAILFDRFQPLIGIVGSSNFTGPGLTSNRELNLSHRVLLDSEEAQDDDAGKMVTFLSDQKASSRITEQNRQMLKSEVGARAILELVQWYEREWSEARPFKEELIELLDASKFGAKEYTPYQVYMKALYEYFRDDLDTEPEQATRSAVELAEFQEDAVKKARKILSRYDGVMIADSVGLGKTWIGKKLLEDYAYHMRQKALVICPASLRKMWTDELADATIAATIISQEELGQELCPLIEEHGDADLILVDESHNFRNEGNQRYGNMESLIAMNGGRGRDGQRKKLILLTATPINNDLFDLYNQIRLFTRNDRGYFSALGIGDLYRYFLRARREKDKGGAALFNLLEEIVIRRTRPFIRQAYAEATIRGEKVHFPERRLKTEQYNLEETYKGIYENIVGAIEHLHLAPYALESYKKDKTKIDEWVQGRGEALVGIFKSRYLKRLESSIQAFRISIRRALEFQKTFESYLLDGKVLDCRDFHKAFRFLQREDEEDDATPTSLATEMDESEESSKIIEGLETVDTTNYDLRKLHEALQYDIEALSKIWDEVKDIGPEQDLKLARLKELLAGPLRDKKVLLFSYYKDTVRYLWHELGADHGKAFREGIGNPNIRQMHGGVDARTRANVIVEFAPVTNQRPDIEGTDKEIDILLSTDVLSEGQNLQDCAHLVNYDLHWNPVRMVQRAGRIDRIGAKYPVLYIHNMFPDEGLERLLGLVERLMKRIADIDRAGFLDASVLGETVHPKNFNTLRRIREEDGAVVAEEESFGELASSEHLLRQLLELLRATGKDALEALPDGIHSGLVKPGNHGVFFYFTANRPNGEARQHFWKYYDMESKGIIDNRYIIANLISCSRDTPRVVEDVPIFEIQEKIIADILSGHEEQLGQELVPKTVDPFQQTVATTLQSFVNHPDLNRQKVLEALAYLSAPLPDSQVKALRKVYRQNNAANNPTVLLEAVLELAQRFGIAAVREDASGLQRLTREDLRLICFDVVSN